MARSLSTIALDIRSNWPNVHFGAVPYLEAMGRMNSVNDAYFEDQGRDVVLRFLSNAGSWRGAEARRVKAELKGMLVRK